MGLVSDIEIRLRADIARLQQDMTQVRRTVDRGMDGVTSAVTAAKRALGTLAAGFGIKEIAAQVLGAQREFDKLNASLVTATGSSAGAAQAFQALQSFAAKTPYSVAEATEAFIKLRNLGLTPSERALASYGNTSAAMGKGLNQMIEAVADAATGEFERLKEFGIKAKQDGDKVSLTFQGVTKTIGNNAKDIENYLMRIGEVEFAGAMERRAATLDGAISALGDTWSSVMRAISTNGIGDGALSGVMGLTNALGDLSRMLSAVGAVTAEEGKKVKESSVLHESLTAVFRGVLFVGINVKNIIGGMADSIVALVNAAGQAAKGDFAGAKETLQASDAANEKRRKNWREEIAVLSDTREVVKLVQGDQLAGYAIVQTAEQKRAAALTAIGDIQNRVNGVNKEAAGDLAKLRTALDTGAISQAEYNRLAGRLNKDAALASTAYKEQQKVLDARTDAIRYGAEAQAFANKQEQERIEFERSTGQMNEADYITARAAADVKALNDRKTALEAQVAIEAKRIDNGQKVRDLNNEIAGVQREIDARGTKTEQEQFALEQRQYREAAEHRAEIIEAAQDQTRAQRDQLRTQQDEIETLGLTERQVVALTAARMRDQAAALERRASIGLIEEENEQLREQAAIMRERADKTELAAEMKRQKEFWKDLDQVAHDTFVSIADGGKGAFQRIKETAKNVFFDWLYQQTLKKWIINIQTSTTGSSLANLFSSSGSGSGGLLSGLSSLFGGSGGAAAVGAKTATGTASSGLSGLGSMGGGIAAAVVAGMMANNSFYDQGWRLQGQANDIIKSQLASMFKGNGFAPITAIMTASMSSFEKILGKVGINNKLASMLSGSAVFARAFGMQEKRFSDQSTLSGTLANGGASLGLSTSYTQKGGWFRSDKSGVMRSDVDAAVSGALAATYKDIQDATASLAQVLGVNADAIRARAQTVSLSLGKDEAANQKAIAEFFAGVSDTLAGMVLPDLARFQAEGETLAGTLQRVVADFVAVDDILEAMGTTSEQAFRSVGAASVEARERLVQFAGGLDSLVSQVQFFNQNFLSQAEQVALVQKPLQEQLAALGYATLTTADQYKAAVQGLVQSGALATEAGAKAYAGLLALAPAFKTVADYTAQIKAMALDGMRDAVSQLADVVEAQKDRLSDAYETAMRGVDAQIDSVGDSLSRMRGLADDLRGAVRGAGTPASAAGARQAAQAQVAAALAVARAQGVLPSTDDLREALSTIGQDSADQFSTMADYLRDVARTNNMLGDLDGITGEQVSAAERQVALLEAQKAAMQAGLDAELARLDKLVENAQSQADALARVDVSVAEVELAIRALNATAAAVPGMISSTSGASVPMAVAAPLSVGTMAAAPVLDDKRLANMESALNRISNSMAQLATQFDQVSAGGNTLIVEIAK